MLAALAALTSALPACAQDAQPKDAQPIAATQAICRPQFLVDGGALDAGTGFVVDLPGRGGPYLLTALHLFGPAAGMATDVPWNEMPSRAKLGHCTALADRAAWKGGAALAVPAAPMSTRDVAAFPLDAASLGKAPHLGFAATPPKAGESVWLVAEVIGAPKGRLLHRATVLPSEPDLLRFRYDDPSIRIQATSGAPIVNAAGQVVGLNLGGQMQGKDMIGVADMATQVLAALAKAK